MACAVTEDIDEGVAYARKTEAFAIRDRAACINKLSRPRTRSDAGSSGGTQEVEQADVDGSQLSGIRSISYVCKRPSILFGPPAKGRPKKGVGGAEELFEPASRVVRPPDRLYFVAVKDDLNWNIGRFESAVYPRRGRLRRPLSSSSAGQKRRVPRPYCFGRERCPRQTMRIPPPHFG